MSSLHPDHAVLTGTWQMLKAELAGEAMPEFAAAKIELEINGGDYQVRFDGLITDRGTFIADGATEPKCLVLAGVEGPNAGRRIPCIYQLVGNRLRVCYGLGGDAPTAFSTVQDTSFYLATYQRKTA